MTIVLQTCKGATRWTVQCAPNCFLRRGFNFGSERGSPNKNFFSQIQIAGIKSRFYELPPDFSDAPKPHTTRRKLPQVSKEPQPFGLHIWAIKHRKMPRKFADIRGPEEVHDKLIYKQYGVQALEGGNLLYSHFMLMQKHVNYHLVEKRMFAVYRIDPPWKAMSKRPLGSRMGGGKAPVHHFATPVKARRIILEIGGQCEYQEIKGCLEHIARVMPFKARAVTQEIVDKDNQTERFIDENNLNPFTFEYCAKHNILGCHTILSPYDWKYFGKYR